MATGTPTLSRLKTWLSSGGTRLKASGGSVEACGLVFISSLLALLCWQVVLIHPGGWLIGHGEDALRAVISWQWADSPSFAPHRHWLPLYFYLNGSLLRLSGHPMAAQIGLNAALSVASLWVYGRVLDRLSSSRGPHTLVLVAVCALTPNYVQNALYARVDALFVFCVFVGILFLLRWLEHGRLSDQACCAAALAAAAFTRYEGWAFALCFLVVARGRARFWLSSLVLSPIAAWSVERWLALGSWGAIFPDIALTAHPHGAGLNITGLGRLLSSFLLGTPSLSAHTAPALGLLGVAVVYGASLALRKGGLHRAYLAIASLPAAGMAYLALVHDYPIIPYHMVVFHMLWMALLAAPLRRLFESIRFPVAVAASVAAAAAALCLGVDPRVLPPVGAPPSLIVGQALKEIASRHFSPGEVVIGEIQSDRPGPESHDYFHVIQAAIHPVGFLPDREDLSYRYRPEGCVLPEQPSLFDLPGPELERELVRRKARLLMVRSGSVLRKVGPKWRIVGGWGPNRFLARRDDRIGAGLAVLLRPMRGGVLPGYGAPGSAVRAGMRSPLP
jgi:hypothetical protein